MPTYTNEQIAAALRYTKGMKYLASVHLGCSPHTIINRVNRSQELQEIIEQEKGARLDTAELKLHEAVFAGESWAIKYILSNQGKDRGFTERTELATPPDQPLQIEVSAREFLIAKIDAIAARELEARSIIGSLEQSG